VSGGVATFTADGSGFIGIFHALPAVDFGIENGEFHLLLTKNGSNVGGSLTVSGDLTDPMSGDPIASNVSIFNATPTSVTFQDSNATPTFLFTATENAAPGYATPGSI